MAFELDLRKIHLGQSGIASFATKPQAIQIARLAVPRCDALDSLPDDEDPIPGDDPIIAYAEQAGIRHDWLVLCWNRFRADMIERKTKKRDWRAHFRNAVRANWYRLWWIKDGQSGLTTMGEQARRAA